MSSYYLCVNSEELFAQNQYELSTLPHHSNKLKSLEKGDGFEFKKNTVMVLIKIMDIDYLIYK